MEHSPSGTETGFHVKAMCKLRAASKACGAESAGHTWRIPDFPSPCLITGSMSLHAGLCSGKLGEHPGGPGDLAVPEQVPWREKGEGGSASDPFGVLYPQSGQIHLNPWVFPFQFEMPPVSAPSVL